MGQAKSNMRQVPEEEYQRLLIAAQKGAVVAVKAKKQKDRTDHPTENVIELKVEGEWAKRHTTKVWYSYGEWALRVIQAMDDGKLAARGDKVELS